MGSKFSTRYSALIETKRLEDMSKDKNLLPVYASSTAKILPYQIAAARFALRSDFLKGCILCDEGSLGKTYEALLVAGQKWYEGKENILVVLPPNLVTQWKRKLDTDFTIPYVFWNNTKNIPDEDGIVLTTYDCAIRHADKIKELDWDLAIFDEADVLANYTKDTTVILKNAVREAYKLLLTPTPITKDIRDIYGLIHFIDESILPDEKCRKLLSLPVIEIEERTNLEKIRLGSLLKDFGNLDEKISKDNKLDLSERYSKAAQRAIIQALEKADNRPVIRDANKEVTVKLKKQAILSPEFRELWDKIKQKTTYRVNIDTETLIKNCVKELSEMPVIPKAKLVSSTAEIELENAGVSSTEMHRRSLDIAGSYEVLPDIVRLISAETLLKRSDIIRILQESGRIKDFINNPQGFYEKALEIISRNRHSLAIDGIKYVKLAGEEYYVQEIFDSAELLANLDRNAVQVEHSVYDYLIYDSGVESRFAKSLDEDPDVKMFFKIPPRFKIETPIGSYNPDWAVFLEKDGEQKLYFVLETKGTTSLFDLRSPERLKIHCGKQHFDALQDGILFSEQPVKDWKEFKINV